MTKPLPNTPVTEAGYPRYACPVHGDGMGGLESDEMKITKKEQLIIDALEEIANKWPKNLWVYAADSCLHIMKKDNGKHAVTPAGGMDPAHIVATLPIDADGGDW